MVNVSKLFWGWFHMVGGSIQLAAIIIMILLAGIAVFQALLTFGYPLGETTGLSSNSKACSRWYIW
jgi:hypothetical protein